MYTTSRAYIWIANEKQYTNLQWEWYIPLHYMHIDNLHKNNEYLLVRSNLEIF